MSSGLGGGLLKHCPLPHAGEAVFARCLSSLKDERVQASKKLQGPQKTQFNGDRKSFLEDIRKVGLSLAVAVCPLEGGGGGEENLLRPRGGGGLSPAGPGTCAALGKASRRLLC